MAETICAIFLTAFLCSCSAVFFLLLYRGIGSTLQRRFNGAQVVEMPEHVRASAFLAGGAEKATKHHNSLRCRVIPFPRNNSGR